MPVLNKVLIIDDESEFYSMLFYHEPDRKIFAATERDALRECENPDITLVILDLSLHGKNNFKNGLNFLKKWLLQKIKFRIPVLVVTNDNDPDTYREAISSGASGFMLKKFYTPEKLQQQIRTTLDNFEKWKPQNVAYDNVFYQKISRHLPTDIERFIELRRRNPQAHVFIHGLLEVTRRFWLFHVFNEYYPDATLKIIDIEKLGFGNLDAEAWYRKTLAATEIRSSYSGADEDEQFVITGLEHINDLLKSKIMDLPQQIPGVIFLASHDLRPLIEVESLSVEERAHLMANPFELTPFSYLHGNEIERLLDYLLSLPSVCPLTSSFLGKKATAIFEPETLKLLKEHRWEYHLEDVKNAVQYTIYQAERRGTEEETLIGPECLPAGILVRTEKPALPPLEPSEQEAKSYIKNVENELRALGHNSLPQSRRQKIQPKLEELSIRYPELFNHTESERVCEVFNIAKHDAKSVNIIMIYHPNSRYYFDRFSVHFKSSLKREYRAQLKGTYYNNDTQNNLDNDFREMMKNLINKADLILIAFCSDLLNWDEFDYHLLPCIENKRQHIPIIPIIARPFGWGNLDHYSELAPFPTIDGKKGIPLSTYNTEDLEAVLAKGMQNVFIPQIMKILQPGESDPEASTDFP